MLERDFTHVANFTGYMGIVFELVQSANQPQRILDIPAGNGLLAERLRRAGHDTVCADINQEKPDYVYADLNAPLPFPSESFDTCLCLEGIEHVIAPPALVAELCRLTRPGGRIILSTPNVQNVFSRFKFLCTGFFFQFTPDLARPLQSGERKDRGHISPLTYSQLRYLFELHGAHLVALHGDRWKKKWLLPWLLPFVALGWVWSRWELARRRHPPTEDHRRMLNDVFSTPALFSRSLICTFRRPAGGRCN
jgi:SAM-dependent methyltransferase